MKTTKKLIQIGDSIGITIEKYILEKLKLEKGNLIEITIKKVK